MYLFNDSFCEESVIRSPSRCAVLECTFCARKICQTKKKTVFSPWRRWYIFIDHQSIKITIVWNVQCLQVVRTVGSSECVEWFLQISYNVIHLNPIVTELWSSCNGTTGRYRSCKKVTHIWNICMHAEEWKLTQQNAENWPKIYLHKVGSPCPRASSEQPRTRYMMDYPWLTDVCVIQCDANTITSMIHQTNVEFAFLIS